MPPVPPKKKTTPAQNFAQIFRVFMDSGATQGERDTAERKLDAWLERHGKTRGDIPSILVQAAADDAAAQPPPPPSDPRDGASHPYDDPQFTPAGLVEGLTRKYVWMRSYVSVIYSLYICFTHVYQKFSIAPRIALTSEEPNSGKSTALDLAGYLVFRPNEEAFGTGAAIRDHLVQGPGTILVDELDRAPAEVWKILGDIWDLGHKQRRAKYSLMVGGRKVLVSLHCPMMAAGVGKFLAPQQDSRAHELGFEPYTEETKPERDFYVSFDPGEFDAVYSYLRHWAGRANLDPNPPMPKGVITRYADNMRGLLSVADSCGPDWGARAREALMILLEKGKAERPEVLILQHGLTIFDIPGLPNVTGPVFDKELRRLDLPDAPWSRYRGPSGAETVHPITPGERAALLKKSGIETRTIRSPGGTPYRGLLREWFVEALRERERKPAHLRLITPKSE